MDLEQKFAGSMKKASVKERGSNTTDNSLSEYEGGNTLGTCFKRTDNQLILII